MKKFSDPNSVTLLFCYWHWLPCCTFGPLIVPVLVALIIAYLLDWPVVHLERVGLKRFTATQHSYVDIYWHYAHLNIGYRPGTLAAK